ncbi:SMP-30/gluconolactonase/LRE family protein [Streptomyces sp. J2-1]|uniref:SMP-30/gluconolactonase/LRE family protein n=1 Tax=Streptomyces corallincola TaxID=2851888 RepID=UPI001C38ABF9|nr:SMP-30/gluconolactonase/LRE family protein [Streptomyces corallincola]MBV2352929.1 SMP-30/gluconolactonase/LRE family protein [Streptomyces corallincola]
MTRALVPLHNLRLGGVGPEDVVVDAEGRVLAGLADGRVVRVHNVEDPDLARVEDFASTGGRPLGLEPLPDGDLLVCDAERGLLRVSPGGAVKVLADSAAGEPLRFCSNVVSLRDGTVYFTVSSRRYPLHSWLGDIVEHIGTGRLLRLAPGSSVPEVVLEGLQFANGLAASADESFLVLAETNACRLLRFPLTGPRAGHVEHFADLPGMPDNLWRDGADGPIWVALPLPRLRVLDGLHRTPFAVRRAVAGAALRVPFRPSGSVGVAAVDDRGAVVHHLARHHSGFRMVTSVCRVGRRLVLGSVSEPGLAVCALPQSVGVPVGVMTGR